MFEGAGVFHLGVLNNLFHDLEGVFAVGLGNSHGNFREDEICGLLLFGSELFGLSLSGDSRQEEFRESRDILLK